MQRACSGPIPAPPSHTDPCGTTPRSDGVEVGQGRVLVLGPQPGQFVPVAGRRPPVVRPGASPPSISARRNPSRTARSDRRPGPPGQRCGRPLARVDDLRLELRCERMTSLAPLLLSHGLHGGHPPRASPQIVDVRQTAATPETAEMANTLYRWRHEARLPEDLAERVDALVIATMIDLMAQVTALTHAGARHSAPHPPAQAMPVVSVPTTSSAFGHRRWALMAAPEIERHRTSDLAFGVAAALGSGVYLLGFSALAVSAPVLVATAMFVLVRFTTARWQALVIAATVPEVASILVTIIRFPDDADVVSYGGPVDFRKSRAAAIAALLFVLVTAAGWLAARLRPTDHSRPDISPPP
jgi:hypothetical protein